MTKSKSIDNATSQPPPKSPPNAWAVAGAIVVVILSSGIAFCCTCFPTGLVAFEIFGGPIFHQPTPAQLEHNQRIFVFAFAVGIACALIVGWRVIRYISNLWSSR